MAMKRPATVGEIIREDVLAGSGCTITEAARRLGIHRERLSLLCNDRAGLSPRMALRLEEAFGVSAELLMRIQTQGELARERERIAA